MTRHRSGPPRRRPGPRRAALEILLSSLVAAVALGATWSAVVPDVVVTVGADGDPRLGSGAASGVFGFDAWFLVLGAACGLLLGPVLFVRHRRYPVVVVVSLVVAGVLGSLLAWWVGTALGPGPTAERAAGLTEGATLLLEPGLEAYGVLLAWPIAGLVAVLVVSAWLDDRSPLAAATPRVSSPDGEPAPADRGPQQVS
ncbi:MAG TPA: hypothetical protein VK894_00915 [Jiangellales bacterium]|nr:hypothetical protein [Jiangellales bacterium]